MVSTEEGSFTLNLKPLPSNSFEHERLDSLLEKYSQAPEEKSAAKAGLYINEDLIGTELGGALKNVMAIAAGVADGLNFGLNARAALITRGLAEITRLGGSLGANPLTFQGLSGMGDLVLTCTGDLSRNRQVGLQLGQGKTLSEIQDGMKMVAEGVPTTCSVHQLSKNQGVQMPITEQVYSLLFENKDPRQAVQELMERELKCE